MEKDKEEMPWVPKKDMKIPMPVNVGDSRSGKPYVESSKAHAMRALDLCDGIRSDVTLIKGGGSEDLFYRKRAQDRITELETLLRMI